MVNNTLKSPGYPNSYPAEMHCNYTVPVPVAMAMQVTFKYFSLEDDFVDDIW